MRVRRIRVLVMANHTVCCTQVLARLPRTTLRLQTCTTSSKSRHRGPHRVLGSTPGSTCSRVNYRQRVRGDTI